MRRISILLALLLATQFALAQATQDVAVQLSAAVQVSPPQITLKWKPITYGSPVYRVYKKAKTATSWGSPIAFLTGADSSYIDASVIIDSAYEYCVFAPGDSFTSTGYIYAGIKCPPIHSRGTIVLIVDSTFIDSCSAGLKHLMDDLSGDGWQVIRHDFLRTTSHTVIKSVIQDDYVTHPDVKAVFLVGHVAVPYSGRLNPDAHPDHLGAWPADVYYGSFIGTWTDASINDVTSSNPANHNVPGDKKWDQTAIPSGVQIQVSRIDFNNMPAFATTEVQMMNSYLAKDHIYKMDSLNVIHRALIADNFGIFYYEAFAANGWRNFPVLVGRDSIKSLPFISTLATSSYQWAYGCGGGTYTSAGGIGNTSDFAINPVNGIFTMLFGSYFGDWNYQNNFLRAPLCSSNPALTCFWAGRPNWFLHHMALGDNIGYSARLTQNNNVSLYNAPSNYATGWVHVALLGDLSLRTDYIKPVIALNVTTPYHNGAILTWTASPDPGVIGYHVYRADSQYGHYTQLTASMITALTYHDLTATAGLKYYMVRPVKLQSTPSGGYYNLGVGMTDTGTVTVPALQVVDVRPVVNVTVFPNPAQNYLNVTVATDNPCITTMYVVDQSGRTYSMVTKQLNSGDNNYSLNITSFAPGMYTLVVKTGNDQQVKKWVKL